MKRVWDSVGFVVAFAGLGYVVLWLSGWTGRLLVSPAWHMAGVAAAGFALVSLLLQLRRRRHATVGREPGLIPRKSAVIFRAVLRKATRPPSRVKARAHFGLRGKPH
jgi:hypothetical protein